MTNGSGAIPESELPFENSEANIDISQIQNKTVSTTVEDTVLFAEPTTDAERLELISQMKQHIVNYGGLVAEIQGASRDANNYNNLTGAIYTTTKGVDHNVTIIGWDDNYNIENFKEGNRPTSNGAWIIKNSWGVEPTMNLTEYKTDLYEYEDNATWFNEQGIYSASDIPNEFIIMLLEESYGEGRVTINNDTITIKMGDKGYMYVSYEDANVYSDVSGIEKAQAKKDYYNIYQNDILGFTGAAIELQENHIYLANVFARNSSVEEWLDKISIYTLQDYKCKVYVNPNGKSKSLEDLVEVKLKDGEEVSVKPGYRTLEFANPIKLTGSSFVVVVEITTEQNSTVFTVESNKVAGYEEAVINAEESFVTFDGYIENNVWQDTITIEDFLTGESIGGNVNIKAFTTDSLEEVVLESIDITQAPTKTVYTEGENFDKTGMKVVAKYSDGTQKEITNYTVVDGKNLTKGQTTVTISYTEDGITKTKTQTITVNEIVEEIVLESIEITQAPTKTVYTEGENFDKTGMKVVAKYSDGTQKEITNYTVVDGENLTKGQTTVTISYTEDGITRTKTQSITVNEAEVTPPVEKVVLESIEITQAPTKTVYTEGENFDKTGMKVVAKYSNQTQKEVTASEYTVVDGTNLTKGQTTVTISYTEDGITKTTTQAITVNEVVEEIVLESIKVIQAPTKTVYTEGENFEKTGMKVSAEYSNGTQKELEDSDYTVVDGENLTKGQTTVTISYTEEEITRTTTQSITVNEVITPDEDREPVSSDFTDALANMESAKLYFYTEDLDKVDVEAKIKISNIKIGDAENTYTYYYYLSGTQGDNKITDWKEVTATQEADGTYSITISLKTEDIENINGIEDSDNLFVYIKEVAEIDGKNKELIETMEISGDNSEVTIYLDGEEIGSIDDILSDKIEIKPDDEDDTLAPGEIPQTGMISITIISIAIIAVIGAVSYHKFKNIDR